MPLPTSTGTGVDLESALSCTTPEGRKGHCIPLYDCPEHMNIKDVFESTCLGRITTVTDLGVCCPLTIPSPTTPIRSDTTAPTSSDKDCGLPIDARTPRVVGGEAAQPGRWPWMAFILIPDANKHGGTVCGGTLISGKHILTAGHCVSNATLFGLRIIVRLGDVDLGQRNETSDAVSIAVAKVLLHPRSDIAILTLKRSIIKSRYILPICLPKNGLESFENKLGTVVGWGTTVQETNRTGGGEVKENPMSKVQRQAEIRVWSKQECRFFTGFLFTPHESDQYICAGGDWNRPAGACKGDSGGPLMVKLDGRWTQIGIVSISSLCAAPGIPNLYTRVTEHLTWIQENTH